MNIVKVCDYSIGKGERFALIGGPCVAESEEICFEIAAFLKELCESRNVSYISKLLLIKQTVLPVNLSVDWEWNRGLQF